MNETIQDVNPNADEIKNLEAQLAKINVADLDPRDNGKVITQNSPVVEQKQQPVQEVPAQTQVAETTEIVDPIKSELERVKGQTGGKTPAEKMAYKLKLEAQRAKEMGVDINEVLGIKPQEETSEDYEDKPLTRKDIEELLRKNNQPQVKSAFEIINEIPDEAEKELNLYYLENVINPNLPEEEKVKTAQTMVNAIKLKNQVVLNNIAPTPRGHSTANSVQIQRNQTDNQQLSKEEELFFRDAKIRGISLSKDEIIKMRK